MLVTKTEFAGWVINMNEAYNKVKDSNRYACHFVGDELTYIVDLKQDKVGVAKCNPEDKFNIISKNSHHFRSGGILADYVKRNS